MNIEQELKQLMATPSEPTPRDLRPYVMSAATLLTADIPEKEFLISSFMPTASFGMVYAPRGLGKTWFAMGLATALVEGRDTFLGWQIHKPGGALYIDGEMSLSDVRDRFRGLLKNKNLGQLQILPSEKLYQDGKPICLDNPIEQESILELLGKLKNDGLAPDLIILDNLSTLRRNINENDNSETQSLLDFLIGLRHRGYAVLLVHHTNKAGEQRGASILEVPMDYIIKLSKPQNSQIVFGDNPSFQVEFTKVRGKNPNKFPFVTTMEKDADGTWGFNVDLDKSEVPDYIIVLRAITETSIGLTQRNLSTKLGFAIGKTNKLVKRLRDESLLVGDIYTPSPRGLCELHDWFPQVFPKPEEYQTYQSEIPF